MSSCLICQRPDICSTTSLESIRTSITASGSIARAARSPATRPRVLRHVVRRHTEVLGALGEDRAGRRVAHEGAVAGRARGCRASRRRPRRRAVAPPRQPFAGSGRRTRIRPHSSHRTTWLGRGLADPLDVGRVELEPAALAPAAAQRRRAEPAELAAQPVVEGHQAGVEPLGQPRALRRRPRRPRRRSSRRRRRARPAPRPAARAMTSAAESSSASAPSCASSRSMTSSSTSSSSACRRPSATSSCCSACRSFALPCPESSRARSRSARERTCWTSASDLASSRRRSLTAVRDATSDVSTSARRPSSSVSRASAGWDRALVGELRRAGVERLDVEQPALVLQGCSGHGSVPLAGGARRAVHGSVRRVLTRVTTVVPPVPPRPQHGRQRPPRGRPRGRRLPAAATATRSRSARRRRGTAARTRRTPALVLGALAQLGGRVVAQVGGEVGVHAGSPDGVEQRVARPADHGDPLHRRVEVAAPAGRPARSPAARRATRSPNARRVSGSGSRPTRPVPVARSGTASSRTSNAGSSYGCTARIAAVDRATAAGAARPSRRRVSATRSTTPGAPIAGCAPGPGRKVPVPGAEPRGPRVRRRCAPAPAPAIASSTASACASGTKTTCLSSGSPGQRDERLEVDQPDRRRRARAPRRRRPRRRSCARRAARTPARTRRCSERALGRRRGDRVHRPQQQRVVRDEQVRSPGDRLVDDRGGRVDREQHPADRLRRVPRDEPDGVPGLGRAGRVAPLERRDDVGERGAGVRHGRDATGRPRGRFIRRHLPPTRRVRPRPPVPLRTVAAVPTRSERAMPLTPLLPTARRRRLRDLPVAVKLATAVGSLALVAILVSVLSVVRLAELVARHARRSTATASAPLGLLTEIQRTFQGDRARHLQYAPADAECRAVLLEELDDPPGRPRDAARATTRRWRADEAGMAALLARARRLLHDRADEGPARGRLRRPGALQHARHRAARRSRPPRVLDAMKVESDGAPRRGRRPWPRRTDAAPPGRDPLHRHRPRRRPARGDRAQRAGQPRDRAQPRPRPARAGGPRRRRPHGRRRRGLRRRGGPDGRLPGRRAGEPARRHGRGRRVVPDGGGGRRGAVRVLQPGRRRLRGDLRAGRRRGRRPPSRSPATCRPSPPAPSR